MNARRRFVTFCAAVAAAVAAGAGAGGAAPLGHAPQRAAAHEREFTSPASGKIQHVVILIQQNRTVDNLFNGFCNRRGQCANTVTTATIVPTPPPSRPSPLPTPTTVPFGSVSLAAPYDIVSDFAFWAQSTDCNYQWADCLMDKFNWEGGQNQNGTWWGGIGCYSSCKHYRAPPYPSIARVPLSEIRPYTAIADDYVLFDNLFQSNFDQTFVALQFLIAAQAGGTPSHGGSAVGTPSGTSGCDGDAPSSVETLTLSRGEGRSVPPCFNYATLGDEIDAAPASQGLSWAFYAPGYGVSGYEWSAYQAISHICEPLNPSTGACAGPTFTSHVVSPETTVLSDVQNGKLASVTWVASSPKNSDHAANRSKSGPRWIASVVNAIGESKYWDSTAIFVVWTSWGGWYDHVAPPYVDYTSLGLRVPMLVVSPYAVDGSVTSRCDPSTGSYETASILRFAEDTFGLSQMAVADARAADPAGDACVFDFNRHPRAFKPIPLR